MPRGKSSNNSRVKVKKKTQYADFRSIKLQLPTDPFLYKLRRYKWLLTNYSRALEDDPTAIPLKDYSAVVDMYTKLCEEAIKKGLDTRDGRRQTKEAQRRMDAREVAEDVQESDVSTADGGEIPFSMGT